MKIDETTPTDGIKRRRDAMRLAQIVFDCGPLNKHIAVNQFPDHEVVLKLIDLHREGVFHYGKTIKEEGDAVIPPSVDDVEGFLKRLDGDKADVADVMKTFEVDEATAKEIAPGLPGEAASSSDEKEEPKKKKAKALEPPKKKKKSGKKALTPKKKKKKAKAPKEEPKEEPVSNDVLEAVQQEMESLKKGLQKAHKAQSDDIAIALDGVQKLVEQMSRLAIGLDILLGTQRKLLENHYNFLGALDPHGEMEEWSEAENAGYAEFKDGSFSEAPSKPKLLVVEDEPDDEEEEEEPEEEEEESEDEEEEEKPKEIKQKKTEPVEDWPDELQDQYGSPYDLLDKIDKIDDKDELKGIAELLGLPGRLAKFRTSAQRNIRMHVQDILGIASE